MVADALSRPTSAAEGGKCPREAAVMAVVPPSSSVAVSWEELADSQAACQQVARLLNSSVADFRQVNVQGRSVWCDVRTGVLRPVVPVEKRRAIFDSIHQLAHTGTRATCRLVSSRFTWPGLASNIKEWCRECVSCQRAKTTQQYVAPVEKIEIPARRFSHVHADIVGPLPTTAGGQRYWLTVIDRSTRWFEVALLDNITAEHVLETFLVTWISRYGLPGKITTDRGTQFMSGTWTGWCVKHHVKHISTTSLHPQSNGMVERVHRQLKEALRARGAAEDWASHLPWVLLGLRAAPKDESAVSAAEVTLGQQLVLPGQMQQPLDIEPPPARVKQTVIPAATRSYAEAVSKFTPLDGADYVYVKRGAASPSLQPPYVGPFRVLERGRKVFKLQVGDRVEVVSLDRLKPHLGELEPEVEVPRGRGQPLGT